MTDLIPNAALAYQVLDHIDAHPESWDQRTWGCGTVACFAGWTVILSGGVIDADGYDSSVVDGPAELVGDTVERAAIRLLQGRVWIDRPDGEVDWLFAADNNREDLGRLVAEIFGPRPAESRSGNVCTEQGHQHGSLGEAIVCGIAFKPPARDIPQDAGSAS